MKKLLVTMGIAASLAAVAQTHFPKTINVDLGAGVNDAGSFTPVVGAGYVFNNWCSLYGRYSFSTGKVENNLLTYREHNAELYPYFTVVSYQDRWFVSSLIGLAYKHQNLLGIPKPSRDVKGHNFGGIVGVEGEWHFVRYLAAFAGVSNRGLLLKEEPRYELFATAGVRTSLRVFKKAGKR
jgi:hypothetical protein